MAFRLPTVHMCACGWAYHVRVMRLANGRLWLPPPIGSEQAGPLTGRFSKLRLPFTHEKYNRMANNQSQPAHALVHFLAVSIVTKPTYLTPAAALLASKVRQCLSALMLTENTADTLPLVAANTGFTALTGYS